MAFDSEFERDVLAQCLREHTFLKSALAVLQAHDFSTKTLAWIWRVLAETHLASRELPTPAVWSARIERAYKKEEDREYVLEVLLALRRRRPTAPRSALEEIRRFAKLAAMRRGAAEILDGIDDGDVERAEQALAQAASETRGTSSLTEAHPWEESWQARLGEYTADEDDRPRIRTPVPTLTHHLNGGLPPGAFGLIAALTNVGKSTFAVDCGYNALVHSGAVVCHFPTEETLREAVARYDARFTGFTRDVLLGGKLTKAEQRQFADRFERVMGGRKSRLFVHELAPLTNVLHCRPVIDRARELHPDLPLVIVFDSLDHLEPPKKEENHRIGQSKVYWFAKTLASVTPELGNCSVWATTQVPQKYVGKPANAQAVSETQDKSRVADAMVVLEDGEDSGDSERRAMELVLVKNRLGRVKRWRYYLDANLGTCEFDERDSHAEEE